MSRGDSEIQRFKNMIKKKLGTRGLFTSLVFACTFGVLSDPNQLAGPASAADYAPRVSRLLEDAGRYYDQGQYSSARNAYREALQLEPKCPHAYNGLGLCAMKENNIGESNGAYLMAIKLDPYYYDGLYNLGNNYYQSGDYAESISYYLRALKAGEHSGKPLDPDLFVSLATVYRDRAGTQTGLPHQADIERSLDFYQRALKLKPEHPQAHAMLGKLYLDQNKLSAAERELRTAVAIKPNYAYAYYMLGQLYKRKKELPAALVALHNSLKNETIDRYKQDTEREIMAMGMPGNVWESFAVGYEELSSANYELAASEFQAAAAKPSRMKAVAFNNYGYSLARSGNLAGSIDAYMQAIKLSPHGLPEPYYNLAQAYLKSKRLDEAEKALKQCLAEAGGNHFLAHNLLGIVLKQKGDLKEALNQYNLALMQSGDGLRVVQFNRGLLFEALGRKQEAAASYAKYLETAPTGTNADLAKERLAHLQ